MTTTIIVQATPEKLTRAFPDHVQHLSPHTDPERFIVWEYKGNEENAWEELASDLGHPEPETFGWEADTEEWDDMDTGKLVVREVCYPVVTDFDGFGCHPVTSEEARDWVVEANDYESQGLDLE